jgi:protein tyrosine phosphatase
LEGDEKMFIATQGPLSITIESLWRLVIAKKIKLLVMLSDLIEDNRVKLIII